MSRSWAGGSTRRWRLIRAQVLATNLLPPPRGNSGQCTQQIPGVCEGQANTVHHTQGRAITGDDPAYLTATCRACNLAIGNPIKRDPQPRSVTKW